MILFYIVPVELYANDGALFPTENATDRSVESIFNQEKMETAIN